MTTPASRTRTAKASTAKVATRATKAVRTPARGVTNGATKAAKVPARTVKTAKASAARGGATKAPAKSVSRAAAKAAATGAPAKATAKTAAPRTATKAPTSKAAPPPKAPHATTRAASTTKAAKTAATPSAPPAPAPPPAKKAPARPKVGPYAAEAKFLTEQKDLLRSERAVYVGQAADLKAEADSLALEREPGDVQFDEESGEGGTVTVDRERDLALSAQALAAVVEIDDALERIRRKTYGMCERCGQAIPKPRLRALPFARLCVACKSGGLSRR